jgi:predicted phage terminase large subunit-like protein
VPKRALREQQNLYRATELLIEEKASGTQLIQELITDGCHGVTHYQLECEKIIRLNAQTAMIENGFVHIPETAPWLAEYLHEMTVFPNGKHDDQVDSTAQFLDWFKRPNATLGHLQAYSQRSGKTAAAETGLRSHQGSTRDRRGQNFLGPAYHHRRGSHRRDVRRGCQLLDCRRLDLAHLIVTRRTRLI